MSYPYDDEPTEELDLPRYRDEDEPPPAKRRARTWVIVAVVGLVVAAAAIVVVKLLTKDPASKAQPGDCIKVNSVTEKSADISPVDCGDQVAVFKIAKKLDDDADQCPTGGYPKYMQSGRGSDFALCLMLNAREGDCFTNFEQPAKLARVDCASAENKVTKVLPGQADEAACDGDSAPLVYPDPPTTFCLGKP